MSAEPGEISLFGRLLELDTGEREAELARLETGNSALAIRLRRLLFAHDSPLLESTPVADVEPAPETLPETIGPYRVIERLGQGGMGNVYLCEQTQPVSRQLAVKVLRAGMDTREVIARFDAERQALALMTHPNIARILDAGTSREGRPYFAMDYVPGLPLLRYCNERALNLKQRLHLFMQICAAVQHAHHKGIIHRDLKPSNILVVDDGTTSLPRIIDFGIAKALGVQLTGKTLHTLHGNLVGTPEYMSPEQADIGAVDVDTRADIYSLGVVLYELLTGCVPFNFSKPVISLNSIQRTLRATEAALPSQRVLRDAEAARHATRCGVMNVSALADRLKGDLDWIVLKALQKDRGRRYESATEFAADVRRHLDDQPVSAARPGAVYLLGKFVRRNAIAVAGSTLLSIMLLAATAYTGYQARELAQERDRVNAEAAKAQQVREFLVELFAGDSPQVRRHPGVAVREILDVGAQQARDGMQEQPGVRAVLLHAIGRVYIALGLNVEAEQAFVAALAGNLEQDRALNRALRVDLAQAMLEQDRVQEAEALLDALLLETNPSGALDASALRAQLYLGELYLRTARVMEAEELFRRIIASVDLDDREQEKTNALAHLLLGKFLFESSRLDEAQPLLERALPLLTAALGEHSTTILQARGLYASLLTTRGDLDRARVYVNETRATAERIYGQNHPATAMAYSDAGFMYTSDKDYAAAEDVLLRALAIYRNTVGETHTRTGIVLNNLAVIYGNTGRLDASLQMYLQVLDIYRQLLGEGSAEAASTGQNIGYLLVSMERPAEAEPYFRKAVEVLNKTYSKEHWLIANVRYGLGMALLAQQRHAEAEIELCAAPPILIRALGGAHFRTVRAEEGVRRLYAAWQQQDARMIGRTCP